MTINSSYPQEVGNNTFNKFVIHMYQVIYNVISSIMVLTLGKRKRNESRLYQKLLKGNEVISSFLVKIYLYKYLNKLGIRKESSIIYIPKYDYKFDCPLNMVDYMSLISREELVLKKFNPKEGDVVLDIGANLGRYTVIAAKKVKQKGKVISIEANPAVYDLLAKNIKLNELTNVVSLNCAVYSEKTTIKFFINKDLKNNQYGTINPDIGNFGSKGLEQFVNVNANTVDSLLTTNNIRSEEVKWMKIDVEGAEFEVIKGSKVLLSNAKNLTIIVEIHNLSNGKTLYNEIKNFLLSHNFKIEFEEHRPSGEAHVIFRNQDP